MVVAGDWWWLVVGGWCWLVIGQWVLVAGSVAGNGTRGLGGMVVYCCLLCPNLLSPLSDCWAIPEHMSNGGFNLPT